MAVSIYTSVNVETSLGLCICLRTALGKLGGTAENTHTKSPQSISTAEPISATSGVSLS